jgi:four helix bundle protein
MNVKSYQDLVAWQKAVELVTSVYLLTKRFPRRETYSLCDQMQRAAISVPSNIAEGQGRLSTREFVRSLGTARGSLFALETQVIIARNLKYATAEEAELLLKMTGELSRILSGLIEALRQRAAAQSAATDH